MVEIADELRSMFSAEVRHEDGEYVVTVPRSEVTNGAVTPGEVYRVAMLARPEPTGGDDTEPTESASSDSRESQGPPTPPVDEGEVREVTIESVGDQGDGIAKVERGYVVIVPGARPGDEPTVEIEQVRQNVAFARVIE
ncbi:MAG: TRAM domain-containing protein [Halorhabdus sp.]